MHEIVGISEWKLQFGEIANVCLIVKKLGGGATQLATINNAVKIPEVQMPQLACIIQHDHGTVILYQYGSYPVHPLYEKNHSSCSHFFYKIRYYEYRHLEVRVMFGLAYQIILNIIVREIGHGFRRIQRCDFRCH